MSQVMLLVGTRKGCFVLESDEAVSDWNVRGPFCESWPVYHAVFDPDAGTIYAAAGSEWHGSAVWRSSDLGETWEHSSEGLNYGDGRGLKLSKVSNLTAAHGRLLAGAEAAGLFESRDGGQTWSLLTTLDGAARARGLERPRRSSRRATSACPRSSRTRTSRRASGSSSRATACSRRRTAARRGRPETRGSAATGRRRRTSASASACTRWSCRRSTTTGCISRTTSECTAATTPASRGRRSPKGCRRNSASPPPMHPHDRDTFYVIPLDPGHARCMPEGKAAVWRTRDAGASWQRLDRRAAAARRPPRRAARGDGERLARRPRPLLRHEHGADLRERRRGRVLDRDRELPPGDLLGRGRRARELVTMAELHLPSTLPPLFPGLPRRLEIEAETVRGGDRPPRGALARLPRPALRARAGAAPPHQRLRRSRARCAGHRARGRVARGRDRRDQRRLSLRRRGAAAARRAGRSARCRGRS